MKKSTITLFFTLVHCFLFSQQIDNLEALLHKCDPAVVKIYTIGSNGEYESQGSGCLISSKGVVVSNFHVLAGSQKAIAVLPNGKQYPISAILDYDIGADIVKFVLSVDVPTPFLNLRKTSILKGESVFAVGYPNGFDLAGGSTVSTGIISGFREIDSIQFIQTSTPFTHGSSGGGLFDKFGNLCGLTSGTFATDIKDRHANLNRVVPFQQILKLNQNRNLSLAAFYDEISNDYLFAEAMELYEQLDWENAGYLFKEHLEMYPEDAVAWFRFGLCNYQLARETSDLGYIPFAIASFENAHELNSTYFYPCMQMAMVYLFIGDSEKAKHWIGLCTTIAPNDKSTFYVLAQYYGNKDVMNHELSIEYYTKCLAMSKEMDNLAEIYYGRGIQYDWIDKGDLALWDYNSCLSIEPDHLDCLWRKAVSLFNRGLYLGACDAITKHHEIDPNITKEGHSIEYWKDYFCTKAYKSSSKAEPAQSRGTTTLQPSSVPTKAKVIIYKVDRPFTSDGIYLVGQNTTNFLGTLKETTTKPYYGAPNCISLELQEGWYRVAITRGPTGATRQISTFRVIGGQTTLVDIHN